MQTLVHHRVRVVDLDDPLAVAELAATPWSPEDPVLLGVASRLGPEQDRVLDRMTTTLVPVGIFDAAGVRGDRRTVEVAEPEVDAARLADLVSLRPLASLALDGLLRLVAETRTVEAGLVAESLAYSTLLAGREFAAWRGGRAPRPVRDGTDTLVGVALEGGLLRIRLEDPDRRNAFSAALRAQLLDALEIARYDTSVSVELSGAGLSFSSGGDLAEFGTVVDAPAGHALRLEASPGRAVHRVADRLTARVHGRCIGAGVEIPAFAGRVVAAPTTTFQLPEISMGLVPGAGGTVSLTRRIGRWRTAFLCLSGAEIAAPRALDWGLVDALA